MNIAFLIPNLKSGGAERVACTLCNQWVSQNHHVDLITWEEKGKLPHYYINPKIKIHQLSMDKTSPGMLTFLIKNITRLYKFRKKIKQLSPDVVISFMPEANVINALVSWSLNKQSIISERLHPDAPSFSKLHHIMRKLFYPFATILCVQTKEIANWFEQHQNLKAVIIPNPINLTEYSNGKKQIFSVKHMTEIVAVGRLDHQKGFDNLINAFGEISSASPDWFLSIYGEGEERKYLESLIEKHQLSHKIKLHGLSDKIPEILKEAHILVHPARYEGFPNIIVEALASNCCVIATDCPGGSKELLADGKYGVLCTEQNLAQTIETAISSPNARIKFANNSHIAVQHLNTPIIAQKWLELIS